jgi:hypothetical protein
MIFYNILVHLHFDLFVCHVLSGVEFSTCGVMVTPNSFGFGDILDFGLLD